MILVIDNYDSFVHNLARYFRRLGQETQVVRNDQLTVAEIAGLNPSAIVLSPGPCSPDQAGVSLELVAKLHRRIPLLGVCLGHQAIIQALGGTIGRADEPRHGRSSQVFHEGSPLFERIHSPFVAARYHSLVGDGGALPGSLKVTARTDDGLIMAVEHVSLPVFGVQFHPESILTECGFQLLANFLRIIDLPSPLDAAHIERLRDDEFPDWQSLSAKPYARSVRLSEST